MTDEPADGGGSVAGRLLDFQAHAEAASREIAAIQNEVDRLLEAPDPGVVTVQLDERGGIRSAKVDPAGRRALGADGLNYAINAAISRARREADLGTVPEIAELEARLADLDLDHLRGDSLFDLAASVLPSPDGLGSAGQSTWNPARTIAITTDRRGVRSVECDASWLEVVGAEELARDLPAASVNAFAVLDRQEGRT